ncbi:GNAT family N-acetyltransferase [Virgibacillus sp. 179-BFC.A HS]|uniref:GNAT family N-acetyltransferase n=1 Tax=Tigheibacillus jepli TaxID=3035914 RepID=A0ABU5CIC1_9BACI|nr:GNAT family N-acetyltransferase [Virgibacillus sp. 179-BFC.A HS]MDY0405569.1 GNAT family N-acetyltransferase [Virgibacillus sp. 179-BFC.A HS]
MIIRPAEENDAAGIAKVHVDSWRTTYKGIVPDTYLFETLTYESRLKNWQGNLSQGHVFVAEDEQQGIVGFANGGKERSGKYPKHEGELYAIYILKDFQKKDIGRKLTERVVHHLVDNGIQSMLVWVLQENPSRYFYEKIGGTCVDAETIQIGGKKFQELAYRWENLHQFQGGRND